MKILAIVNHGGKRRFSLDRIQIDDKGPVYLCQEAYWYKTANSARDDAARIMDPGETLHTEILEIGRINRQAVFSGIKV